MKKIIWLFSFVIVTLGIGLFYSIRLNVTNKNDYLQRSILYKFDQTDLNRINTLYERFLDHEGDYLVVIGPTIDSGPAITNINSNGKEIVWINDMSRDAYSNGAIEVYKCRNYPHCSIMCTSPLRLSDYRSHVSTGHSPFIPTSHLN